MTNSPSPRKVHLDNAVTLPTQEMPLTILDRSGISESVSQIADAIAESRRDETGELVLIGLFTRGVTLADRLSRHLSDRGIAHQKGSLDVSLYRDDFGNRVGDFPKLKSSEIDCVIDGARVVLCDEVIHTGRTIRAALDGILDYGRPDLVQLAVLIDRGHREFPIQADYTGKTIETSPTDYVAVRFEETDGEEGVFLRRVT